MSTYLSLIVLICALLPLTGCGGREGRVVAEVAGEKIRVRDMEQAYAKLPGTDGTERMKMLWALIDRELLILEAQRRGLEATQHIQEKLRQAETDRLLKVHRKRILEGIEVSEEEIRRYFEENGLDAKMEVQVSHIMLETREGAEKILKELEEGTEFAELVRERSIDKVSAAKGGDLGYWEQGRTTGPMAQKVFSMKVGGPPELFQSAQGYHIIRVMEGRPVGFERQRARIKQRIRARKLREKELAYMERLREASGLQINRKALLLLLNAEDAADNVPSLDVQASSMPLLTFDGGAITLGEYSDRVVKLKPGRRPALGDSAQVVQFAQWIALNTVLLNRALYEAKLHETEEVRTYLAKKRRKWTVEELRRIEAEEKVITYAAIEEYYRAHWEDYFNPETIWVETVWTQTEEEAHRAFRKIQAGVEMAEVARMLSSPSDKWGNHDILEFRSTDKDREWFGEIVQEAEKTEPGQLEGPVRVFTVRRDLPVIRYAVFRVLSKIPGRQRSIDEQSVQADIWKRLSLRKRAEIETAFQAFLLELREQYADRIHLNEKNLKFVSLPEKGNQVKDINR